MEQQISAERRRRAVILEAQGDAVSTVLRAKSAESMGERVIIEKGMETLESIGEGESTTFVLPGAVLAGGPLRKAPHRQRPQS